MTIYAPGKLTLSKIQQYPAAIGQPWGGGYFAGYISHTADGNPTHALIVAPRATGATGTGYTLTTNLQWKTAATATPGTDSTFDGVANTTGMVVAGINDHPAAKFCTDLTIGGYTDWYLPSRYEADIAYFNLKPTSSANNTSFGDNPYSVPLRSAAYTEAYPSLTPLALFAPGGAESFVANNHWSSTEAGASSGWRINFSNGQFNAVGKSLPYLVRAFRRIALP